MVHKPKIKDEETNYGPQDERLVHRRRDKLWSTNLRLKTKRQTMVHKPKTEDEQTTMVHKPKIKDEETNYGPQTND